MIYLYFQIYYYIINLKYLIGGAGLNNFEEEIEDLDVETYYLEILNYYRNLYHTEPAGSERRIISECINKLFMELAKNEVTL